MIMIIESNIVNRKCDLARFAIKIEYHERALAVFFSELRVKANDIRNGKMQRQPIFYMTFGDISRTVISRLDMSQFDVFG